MRKMLILLSAALIILVGCSKKEEVVEEKEPIEMPDENEIEVEVDFGEGRSLTSGTPLEDSDGNLFSVMIENSPQARPHTGLIDADIVYEMEVEYNVTRFLAIFNDKTPTTIGPVRSARHYYLPFTESWNAPYYHYGASHYAAEEFPTLKVEHYDGTSKGHGYYIRDNTRSAPHNAYLKTERMKEKVEPTKNPHFTFTDQVPESELDIGNIEIFYSSGNTTTYKYDENKKVYNRFIQGVAHIDSNTHEGISVKNVIALYAEHIDLNTSQKHIDINFKGGGDLAYYIEGKKVNGSWKSINNELIFYDDKNEALKVLPGNTWIQVVDQEKAENVTEG